MGDRSGQQRAEENRAAFAAFVAERDASGDWCAYLGPGRTRVLRTTIAARCGFSVSALHQNPAIRRRLAEIEERLRHADILAPIDGPVALSPCTAAAKTRDQRIEALGQRLLGLEETLAMLRDMIDTYAAEEERLRMPGDVTAEQVGATRKRGG